MGDAAFSWDVGGHFDSWDDEVVSFMDSQVGTFSLSVKFKNTLDNFEWWLTGVYGPYISNLKPAFMDELK